MCCKFDICKILSTMIFIFLILILIVCMNCSNTEDKSILTAVATTGDNTDLGNAIIKFSKNNIVEGTAISHQEGTSEFNINETGIYQISYQLYGVNNAKGTFNFNAIILKNGATINETLNSSPVLTDDINNRMTLTSTVILSLNAGDVIQLGGTSLEDILYTDARMDIVKIK